MLLAFSFCSDLADTWSFFCPSHLYLYGKPFYRPVISEQWAVFLSAVALCKLSAPVGGLLSSSLPRKGNGADGSPCSLGLTGCVFGKREQMVTPAALRRNKSTSWIYLAKVSSVIKQRKFFQRVEAIKLLV